jgi:hypothetical protein
VTFAIFDQLEYLSIARVFEITSHTKHKFFADIDAPTLYNLSLRREDWLHFSREIRFIQKCLGCEKKAIKGKEFIGSNEDGIAIDDTLKSHLRFLFAMPEENRLWESLKQSSKRLLCLPGPISLKSSAHCHHKSNDRTREPLMEHSGHNEREERQIVEVPLPTPYPRE